MAFSATGGTKTTDGDYTVHKFTSSGSLVCTETAHAEVLVVGGGGASSNDGYDAGGGAGELITHSWYLLTGTMTVTIGNGGTVGENNGGNTVFGGITALGGGHGMGTTANGHSGGSGGGGGGQGSGHTGGAATEGTLDGGTSYRGAGKTSLSNESGGGGGAGASGGSGHDGCAGIDSDIVLSGTQVGYAGGGGGWPSGSTSSHGGGNYSTYPTENTGGGAGAGRNPGAKGIVVVRYLTAGDPVNMTGEGGINLAPVAVSGAGSIYQPGVVTTDGDYTVVTYSTPGQGRFHAPTGWTAAMTAEVLVVAGGGGGGVTSNDQAGGGGGGAGGYLTDAALASIADHEAVTIGAGGAAGVNGTDSVFKSLQSYGGGFGAAGGNDDAGDGGSGGGLGATNASGGAFGSGTVGQGHDGATASVIDGSQYGSGGSGGGATSAGTQGSYSTQPTIAPATSGGAGTANDISGASLTYAVGGGGGQGGGSSVAGAAGTDGRGNGGSGGQGGGAGGKGGTGVVVIRYYTPKNEMYVTLGSVRATGSAHVSAAYSGVGTSTLGVVRVAGLGTNPIYGSGRLALGPVKVPLGISANTLYLRGDVRIYVGAGGGGIVAGLGANCTISVAGEEDMAWLRDTGEIISLEADCTIRVAEHGDTLLNTDSLPATDALGWTAPDRDTPALRGLVVTLAGKRVSKNLIKDLTIDLSDRGGYDRATLVLDKSVRVGQAAMLSTLRVTYKSTVLFRGRLEARGPTLGHDMQHVLTFTGPIVQLKDHRGFRRVYADSDLSSWQTGQGPNTSANVFEVQGS